jgi:hypothetical protein
MVVRLSTLGSGRIYPQEILLVLISVRGWVDTRTIVRSEGFMSMTPPGIEPVTFWFVAQYLNHCATAVGNRGLKGLRKLASFQRNLLLSISLKMEAAHWSETSLTIYQTTRQRIPQLANLHCHTKCFCLLGVRTKVSITFEVDYVVLPSVNVLYHNKTDL